MADTLCGMPYEDDADCGTVIWTEKRVKTRKVHRCFECSVEIPVGESAGVASHLYDGRWDHLYRCAACLILAEWAATIEGVCALWGGLDEFISNLNWGREDEDRLPTPREHRQRWERFGEVTSEGGRV